jgi:glycosyltransferase involved in cell wall biosynthesis
MTREVPAYRADSFAPRRHRYMLSLFVLNEGERLLTQLGRMEPHLAGLDLVIADGGSTDRSTDRERVAPRGVRAVLHKQGAPGLGGQMRMAFDFALREGYDGVVAMDGNNKDDPSALPLFVAALEDGVDHVQGSRYITGGRHINTPWSRHWGVRLLHAPMIRLAAGFPYTDTTNGFRAYSRRFLDSADVAVFRDVFTGYELHYYLAIRAARRGFTVREVPVTRAYPARGKTPTKITPLKGNARVLRALFAACLGRFDPPGAAIASGR